ncbi:SusE domain-containing protein [Aquimarina sp. D1M17]|uniref:SusE domain-containing protein n=1 Tax=Aquimarina acroporae TaxID=2937283 RepID=UPI0020BE35AA|nr:SusE domain-containing protein [Aquimarina acroporae]MCK8524061.1 SusE domain-containing protein [Aquimarina acroporae]
MKKISILMFAFIALLCFNACVEDEEPTFVVQNEQSEGPLVVSASSNVTLTKDTADNLGFTLVWEDAGYNVNTPISYSIEAAAAGTDFASPTEVAVTTDRFYSWTIGELNGLALTLELEPDNEASMELRVVSSLGTNGGAAIVSNSIALTVTPYSTVVPQKDLFLVGSATAPGWNNGDQAGQHPNTALVRDPNNENLFKFTGWFLGGGDNAFKLLETPGFWQPQWGDDGGSITSSDILGGDPGVLSVAADGYYEITVDIENFTFEANSFDASASASYATIGIIGDSTPNGWDSDTDMTQSTFNEHLWYIIDITLTDGEMKFRHSDDWPGNWGADTAISGQATTDGNPPNIPVTAGTYDIWFSDLDGRFIFIPKG